MERETAKFQKCLVEEITKKKAVSQRDLSAAAISCMGIIVTITAAGTNTASEYPYRQTISALRERKREKSVR
jgi:hypothetical protein